MTELQKRLAEKNGTLSESYGDLVNQKIRLKYSLSKELSLLRQKEEKPEEYAQYTQYAEQCKIEAKKEVYGT